jgi:peptidoglycan hydrolase-like protein with peptidoglycan-binding domain
MARKLFAAETTSRAQFWVDGKFTYSQSHKAPDPNGKLFRTDCSGLACMVYDLDTTNYYTGNFLSVPGIIVLGSLSDLTAGDLILREGHMELFVRWQDASNHQAGAFVYSFNKDGETVRNPYARSNFGNFGFNDWQEMLTYRPLRYANILDHGAVVSPPSGNDHPVLRRGAKGEAVKELQALLNRRGFQLEVDGDFGGKTDAAVRDFQTRQQIEVDGVVGRVTWGRLASAPPGSNRPVLRRGSGGDSVKELQTRLNKLGYGLGVDGDFGPMTEKAVRDFQSRQGIAVDGVVGAVTWGRLPA